MQNIQPIISFSIVGYIQEEKIFYCHLNLSVPVDLPRRAREDFIKKLYLFHNKFVISFLCHGSAHSHDVATAKQSLHCVEHAIRPSVWTNYSTCTRNGGCIWVVNSANFLKRLPLSRSLHLSVSIVTIVVSIVVSIVPVATVAI